MSKLTLDALKERAGAVASEDLLNSISGGTENACHDDGIIIIDQDVIYEEPDGTYVAPPFIKL